MARGCNRRYLGERFETASIVLDSRIEATLRQPNSLIEPNIRKAEATSGVSFLHPLQAWYPIGPVSPGLRVTQR